MKNFALVRWKVFITKDVAVVAAADDDESYARWRRHSCVAWTLVLLVYDSGNSAFRPSVHVPPRTIV